MNSPSIFITGGTGFLGSEVVARLLSETPSTHPLFLMVRKTPNPDTSLLARRLREHNLQNQWSRLKFIQGDLSQPTSVESSFREFFLQSASNQHSRRRVVHMGAMIHAPGESEAQHSVNVGSTEHLLKLCQVFDSDLIYLSTVAAFGGSLGPEIRSERDFSNFPWVSQAFNYYTTKREAHERVIAGARPGQKVVVLCPGVIHGSLEESKSSRSHLSKIRMGKLRVAPPGGLNIVSLKYTAQCILESTLSTTLSESVCTRLVVGENYLLSDYFQKIADLAHAMKLLARPVTIHRLPTGVGYWSLSVWSWMHLTPLAQRKEFSWLESLAQGSLYCWFQSDFVSQDPSIRILQDSHENILQSLNDATRTWAQAQQRRDA